MIKKLVTEPANIKTDSKKILRPMNAATDKASWRNDLVYNLQNTSHGRKRACRFSEISVCRFASAECVTSLTSILSGHLNARVYGDDSALLRRLHDTTMIPPAYLNLVESGLRLVATAVMEVKKTRRSL